MKSTRNTVIFKSRSVHKADDDFMIYLLSKLIVLGARPRRVGWRHQYSLMIEAM